jgi:hypothetical protein
MFDAAGIKRRGPPLDTVHGIALAQKQFGQIGTILTSHPGNKRGFCHFFTWSFDAILGMCLWKRLN